MACDKYIAHIFIAGHSPCIKENNVKISVGGVIGVCLITLAVTAFTLLVIRMDNRASERRTNVATAQITAYCSVSAEDRSAVAALIKALKENLPIDGDEAWNYKLSPKTSAALEAAANGKFDCSKQ